MISIQSREFTSPPPTAVAATERTKTLEDVAVTDIKDYNRILLMNYIQLDRRMVALILIELLARNFLVTQAINTRSMLITNWAQK